MIIKSRFFTYYLDPEEVSFIKIDTGDKVKLTTRDDYEVVVILKNGRDLSIHLTEKEIEHLLRR